jgi:GTP-binding protein
MRERERLFVRRPSADARMAAFAERDDEIARQNLKQRNKLPLLAVVGRPNVGKSTIVNRICGVGQDGAIVYDEPGVTRDRTYQYARFENYCFTVVDTGGLIFEDDPDEVFAKQIRQQAMIALKECKAAIVVVDGQTDMHPTDEEVARMIQKDFLSKGINVYLAVNKCEAEGLEMEMNVGSYWNMGIGEPHPVSGIHGKGLYELLQDVCYNNFKPMDDFIDDRMIKVALVGRPNVGKSSLLNRMLAKERAIVSDVAGTTRDSIDCELQRGDQVFKLVDTAGLRAQSKVEDGNEFLMVNRTMKAIDRADVCLLVLDCTEPGIVTAQDKDIANHIVESGKACVILLNKWDLQEKKDEKTYLQALEEIEQKLPNMPWAERLLVSAATGQRCSKIFQKVIAADKSRRSVMPILELNDAVFDIMRKKPPISPAARKGGRVYYSEQVMTKPPKVVLAVNSADLFSDNYKKYLERALRGKFDLEGTTVSVVYETTRQRDAVRNCPLEIASFIWDAYDREEETKYTALCA